MSFEAPTEYTGSIEITHDLIYTLLIAMTLDGGTKSFRIIDQGVPPDARNMRMEQTDRGTAIIKFESFEDVGHLTPAMQTVVTSDEEVQVHPDMTIQRIIRIAEDKEAKLTLIGKELHRCLGTPDNRLPVRVNGVDCLSLAVKLRNKLVHAAEGLRKIVLEANQRDHASVLDAISRVGDKLFNADE